MGMALGMRAIDDVIVIPTLLLLWQQSSQREEVKDIPRSSRLFGGYVCQRLSISISSWAYGGYM